MGLVGRRSKEQRTDMLKQSTVYWCFLCYFIVFFLIILDIPAGIHNGTGTRSVLQIQKNYLPTLLYLPNVFCPVLTRVICNPSRATDESVELLAVACVLHVDEATHARLLRPPWWNTPAPHTRRAPCRATAKLRAFFDQFDLREVLRGEYLPARRRRAFFPCKCALVCVCVRIRSREQSLDF